MAIPAMDEALKRIHESIQRKKGSFELVQAPDGFALAAGSHRAVKVDGGFIICIKLSKEQVEYLKRQCEEALAQKAD
jgi:hypothetical protein